MNLVKRGAISLIALSSFLLTSCSSNVVISKEKAMEWINRYGFEEKTPTGQHTRHLKLEWNFPSNFLPEKEAILGFIHSCAVDFAELSIGNNYGDIIEKPINIEKVKSTKWISVKKEKLVESYDSSELQYLKNESEFLSFDNYVLVDNKYLVCEQNFHSEESSTKLSVSLNKSGYFDAFKNEVTYKNKTGWIVAKFAFEKPAK